MTELKTLKDLDFTNCGDFVVEELIQNKLKQEAIKWVKNLESSCEFSIRDIFRVINAEIPCEYNNLAAAVILTEFFNLTEADLTELKGGIIDNE